MKVFGLSTKKLLIGAILVLAFILRFVWLDKYPVGFTPDEASYGYDAYSLLKTGKDQWGDSWPLTFRSFGDSKLPVYAYITIPSVAALGLNEFATRLPSAIFGVLAVLATYLLAGALFKKRGVAIISAFLLAISPWHVALSRGAFEANLTVFFMAFGAYTFLRGLKDKRWFTVSAASFGINIFTYHSARLVTPLVFLILVLLYKDKLGLNKLKDILKVVRNNYLPVIIFSAAIFISVYSVFSGGSTRAGDIAIFNPTDEWMSVFDRRYEAVFEGLPSSIARIFSNKAVSLFDWFTSSYITYLSPQFLFTQGAAEWTYGMIPGRGVVYLFEALFILASLWFVARFGLKKEKALAFIFLWILIGPIPAALTKGPGYAANRAAVMMPAVQIFSAFGAILLYNKILENYKKISANLLKTIFLGTAFIFLVFFIEDYLYHAPRGGAESMLYGRKETIEYTSSYEDSYKTIIFSRSLSEPQIFVAFYSKWDTVDYQKEAQNWLIFEDIGLSFVDQLGEYRLGKYVFKNISFNEHQNEEAVLLVGKPSEFPADIRPTRLINFPNQEPAIIIFDPANQNYAYSH
jgi:4-amino-4-deoxy-L-arabinose transferase-like glycosyltransferase